MDVSKLPRLSKTETPVPPPDEAAAPAPPVPAQTLPYGLRGPYERLPTGRGPEAYISIGVGLIFLFMFPHFTQWWVHVVFHTRTLPSFLPITLGEDGPEIPYQKSVFFFNDLSIASFAYALIVEGIALVLAGRDKPGVVLFALLVTVTAVVLNVCYIISSFGEGFPVVSAIAVLFGGYMIWFQWTLAKELIAIRRATRATPPAGA